MRARVGLRGGAGRGALQPLVREKLQVRVPRRPMYSPMVLQAALACPSCGRATRASELVCSLCGRVLRHEVRPRAMGDVAPATAPGTEMPVPRQAQPDSVQPPRSASSGADASRARLEPWFYFGLGLVTAPVFALTQDLRFMGWFLASLVHEMGHAAVAWFFGMPAVPAISLEGHAAAVHAQQQVVLVLLVWAGLASAAWKWLDGAAKWIGLALACVAYPLLAFTDAKDLFHLLAGHGAELVFATLCLWKALDGGFTSSRLERALYGTVGWYLVGKNVSLCFGLMTSAGARATYHENGSFGFTNDFLRVAQEVLGCSLQTVGAFMLLASFAVVPVAILVWRLIDTRHADEAVLSDD